MINSLHMTHPNPYTKPENAKNTEDFLLFWGPLNVKS